jgi:hypothetical protein
VPFIITALLTLGMTVPPSDKQIVDHAVFEMSLRDFVRQRFSLRRAHRHLDWTTDYCSAPIVGNEGRSFNFRNACMRHDFAYRNYRRLGIFDAAARSAIDAVFHADLVSSCLPKRVSVRLRCLSWAQVFFETIRVVGGP